MANKKTLIPAAHKLTVEEQSKGGKASAQKRRERKTLREEFLSLLQSKMGNKDTAQQEMAVAMILKAMRGDVRAFEVIRDTIGEKPVEAISVNTPDPAIMEEIRRRMEGENV